MVIFQKKKNVVLKGNQIKNLNFLQIKYDFSKNLKRRSHACKKNKL